MIIWDATKPYESFRELQKLFPDSYPRAYLDGLERGEPPTGKVVLQGDFFDKTAGHGEGIDVNQHGDWRVWRNE